MATVQIFTAARMQAIEDQAIVNAELRDGSGSNKELVLIRNNATEINVGNVRGPIGVTPTVPDELNWRHTGVLAGSAPSGGTGVPPLKYQAGTVAVTTNTEGRELISFADSFLGVCSVVVQVAQASPDVVFTNIDGGPGGTYGVSVENIQLLVGSVTTTNFLLTVACGGGAGAYGIPVPGIRLGGTSAFQVNWMAFGW